MGARAFLNGSLGKRRRERLMRSKWFDNLLTLSDIDEQARKRGISVVTVDEALRFLREFDKQD